MLSRWNGALHVDLVALPVNDEVILQAVVSSGFNDKSEVKVQGKTERKDAQLAIATIGRARLTEKIGPIIGSGVSSSAIESQEIDGVTFHFHPVISIQYIALHEPKPTAALGLVSIPYAPEGTVILTNPTYPPMAIVLTSGVNSRADFGVNAFAWRIAPTDEDGRNKVESGMRKQIENGLVFFLKLVFEKFVFFGFQPMQLKNIFCDEVGIHQFVGKTFKHGQKTYVVASDFRDSGATYLLSANFDENRRDVYIPEVTLRSNKDDVDHRPPLTSLVSRYLMLDRITRAFNSNYGANRVHMHMFEDTLLAFVNFKGPPGEIRVYRQTRNVFIRNVFAAEK